MAKLTALLTGMLLTCALLLVTSQHQARKAFIDLERAQATARKHEIEWNQLQLEQTRLAKHSLIDLAVRAKGDLHIDDHHTVEDVGIALGQALARALGDKRGIRRYGHFALVMDDTKVEAALDLSARRRQPVKLPLDPGEQRAAA